jgi:hypothetical protein
MLILPKRTIMTEITELALRVLRILRLERTWPLIGAAKTAIQTEAEFAGCTLAEAAASLIEDGRQVQERGESVNILALPRERRTDRMRRLDKEERKVILCNEFLDDCPLCTCGNLFLKRKHNGEGFVGCDCFYDSGCSCKYSCAVPEHNPTHPLPNICSGQPRRAVEYNRTRQHCRHCTLRRTRCCGITDRRASEFGFDCSFAQRCRRLRWQ